MSNQLSAPVQAYCRVLTRAMDIMERQRSVWLVFTAILVVAYYGQLFRAIGAFSGNWSDTGFFTYWTVIPWLVYAVLGLFLVPYVFAVMTSDSNLGRGPSNDSIGIGVPTMLGCWLLIPYTCIMIVSGTSGTGAVPGPAINCRSVDTSVCARITAGEVPATVFGTVNPDVMIQRLEECAVCADSPLVRKALDAARQIKDVLDKVRRESQQNK